MPESTTATSEFVVPRSMPTILLTPARVPRAGIHAHEEKNEQGARSREQGAESEEQEVGGQSDSRHATIADPTPGLPEEAGMRRTERIMNSEKPPTDNGEPITDNETAHARPRRIRRISTAPNASPPSPSGYAIGSGTNWGLIMIWGYSFPAPPMPMDQGGNFDPAGLRYPA